MCYFLRLIKDVLFFSKVLKNPASWFCHGCLLLLVGLTCFVCLCCLFGCCIVIFLVYILHVIRNAFFANCFVICLYLFEYTCFGLAAAKEPRFFFLIVCLVINNIYCSWVYAMSFKRFVCYIDIMSTPL